MGYSYTWAGVTTTTGADLDGVLNQAGLLGTIACTVSGTNTLALTPAVYSPPVVLQLGLRVSAIAANTNTGATTANVAGLGALAVYADTSSGPAALSGNEIQAGNYFVLSYDATLNSGAGGWHLDNGLVGGAPTGSAGGDLSGSYPNPGVAKINGVPLGTTTATSGALLVANGSAWAKQAVSGDATLASTGALTVAKTNGTSFTGAATMPFVGSTSWTPTDNSGASLTFSSVSAHYVRMGNMVFAYFSLTYPSTADTSAASIAGLPVGVPNQTYAQGPAACWVSSGSIAVLLSPVANSSTAAFYNHASGAAVTNANLSGLTVRCILIYPVA